MFAFDFVQERTPNKEETLDPFLWLEFCISELGLITSWVSISMLFAEYDAKFFHFQVFSLHNGVCYVAS